MKFRLAFAAAISANFSLLLIDEVISSGDINFQNKVVKTILNAQNKNKLTTLVSSHIPALVASLADVFFMMTDGRINPIDRSEVDKLIKVREKKYLLRKRIALKG